MKYPEEKLAKMEKEDPAVISNTINLVSLFLLSWLDGAVAAFSYF